MGFIENTLMEKGDCIMIKIFVWNVRDKKHMSLRQLSQLSGVSRAEINFIENNQIIPKIDTLCAIARALQVPVTDLFEDTNGIKKIKAC